MSDLSTSMCRLFHFETRFEEILCFTDIVTGKQLEIDCAANTIVIGGHWNVTRYVSFDQRKTKLQRGIFIREAILFSRLMVCEKETKVIVVHFPSWLHDLRKLKQAIKVALPVIPRVRYFQFTFCISIRVHRWTPLCARFWYLNYDSYPLWSLKFNPLSGPCCPNQALCLASNRHEWKKKKKSIWGETAKNFQRGADVKQKNCKKS